MKIDSTWHKEQIKKFKTEYKNYKTYAEVLYQILDEISKICAPIAIVQTRVKTSSSFAEKIIRKNKYTDPLNQITDLCGARILVHTLDEVEQVCNLIRKNFLIDEKNSLDVKSRLNVDEFGYLAVHFIVTPEKKNILDVKIPDEIRGKKAEIQVRTILQHTWSDIFHDRIYKTYINVPEDLKREFFCAAAILENVDKNFNKLARSVDVFLNNYAAFLPNEKLSAEIDILRALLDIEPEKDNKPQIALRLAKTLKFQGQWEVILNILKPYKNINNPIKHQIQLEYGNAFCQKYFNKQNHPEFKKGIQLLEGLTQLQDKLDDTGRIVQEVRSLKAKAWSYLGEAYSNRKEQFAKAHYCFLQAFELDIYNPYYLISYIEWELYIHKDRKILKPLTHAIKNGIEKCQEHIRVGIEMLNAYLTIGKFWLLLDEPYKSLDAYTKAIDLCISGKACVRDNVIDIEINSLARLYPEKIKPKEFVWVELLLTIAKALKTSNKSILKNHVVNTDGFSQPLIIIAGDADQINIEKIPKCKIFLYEGLINYKGTIISGGTTSGIPGLVGEVKNSIIKTGKKEIKLFGYIPSKFRGTIKRNNLNYDKLYITKGQDFSPLEPLLNWIDIINVGIEPKNIKVLGLGGGSIADFEYKLALCLGAKVGVIEFSGRAVAELITNENWSDHPNLAILPEDIMTLKAYLHVSSPERLTDKQILKAAKHIHNKYCEIRKKEAIDERTEPWEKLKESYKSSNLEQVKYMEALLNEVNYGIREVNNIKRIASVVFAENEVEKLAELEHGRWNAEKLSTGWKYAKVRDNTKKHNPYIVPWSELSSEVKQFDRDAVLEFPIILKEAGFEVYKLKK